VRPALSWDGIDVYYSSEVAISVDVEGGSGDTLDYADLYGMPFGYTTVYGPAMAKVTLGATSSYTVSFGTGSFTFQLIGWKLSDSTDPNNAQTVYVTTPKVLMGRVKSVQPVYALPSGMVLQAIKQSPEETAGGYFTANLNLEPIELKAYVLPGDPFPSRNVIYQAYPKPGYCWCKATMNGEVGGRSIAGGAVTESTTGSGDFVQLAELTVKNESEGTDPTGAKPECMGYYTVDPAYKYYTPDLPAVGALPGLLEVEGDEVTVTAVPRPGYRFVRWVGTGSAKVGGTEVALDREKYPVTSDTIKVIMHRNRELTAVFALNEGVFELYVDQPRKGDCAVFGRDGFGGVDTTIVGHTWWMLVYPEPWPEELRELSHYIVSEPDKVSRKILGSLPEPFGPDGACIRNYVEIVGSPTGFYPRDGVNCDRPWSPPQINCYDTGHMGLGIIIKPYPIKYREVLSAARAVTTLLQSDAYYKLAVPGVAKNCTTVALEIGRAAGLNLPAATAPGPLGQYLNGETCDGSGLSEELCDIDR
jgi:hypothetical protein